MVSSWLFNVDNCSIHGKSFKENTTKFAQRYGGPTASPTPHGGIANVLPKPTAARVESSQLASTLAPRRFVKTSRLAVDAGSKLLLTNMAMGQY